MFIALAIVGISCTSTVNYKKIIENKTDYSMVMIFADPTNPDYVFAKDTFVLPPKQSITIMNISISDVLVSSYSFCPPSSGIVEVDVIDSTSVNYILIKDLFDANNWTYAVTEKKINGGGACECKLVIEEEDIIVQ